MEIKLECKIEELINKKGLKRVWVAEQSEVSRQQLGNWIRQTSYPNTPKMYVLARLLGVEITDLYEVEWLDDESNGG